MKFTLVMHVHVTKNGIGLTCNAQYALIAPTAVLVVTDLYENIV